jgi:arginyl-tRNA synthetase
MDAKNYIYELVGKAAGTAGLPAVSFDVSFDGSGHGDLASNYALKAAKEAGKPPREVAEILVAKLVSPDVESAEVAGPGFINIVMTKAYWSEQLAEISPDFGKGKPTGKRVNVEFISANPTGPLTLGNGRGGFTGDVLANVLSYAGNKVTREYYINDAGNQIRVLKNSIYALLVEALLLPHQQEFQELYKGEYVAEIAEEYAKDIRNRYPDYPNTWSSVDVEKYVEENFRLDTLLDLIKAAASRMGIHFDTWYSEQKELHDTGKVDGMLATLKSKDLVYEKDDAVWLKTEQYGDQRDRVLKKKDGNSTYLLADMAYHYNKLVERSANKAINLWGADHAGQVPSLKAGLKAIDLDDRLDVIVFQLVRLIKDGQEFKVSKRAGTYVTVDELLDELDAAVGKEYGSDVARWFFLSRSPDSQMDFDLTLAKEQSQKNPMFYVMYSYARAHSILGQASERGVKPAKQYQAISAEEVRLIKTMVQLPALLEEMTRDYGVHRLTFYGMELAKQFHDLYEKQHILGAENEESLLYLIQQYILFLDIFFGLLGIKPSKKM